MFKENAIGGSALDSIVGNFIDNSIDGRTGNRTKTGEAGDDI